MSTDLQTKPQLNPGLYEIINHGTDRIVYRNPGEDKSNRPKPIFALPPGIQPHFQWIVEKKANGKYILKAGQNNPAGPLREHSELAHVYAFLDGQSYGERGHPAEWEITRVIDTQHKEGWIIETTLRSGLKVGWSVYTPEEQRGFPIVLRPLPSTRSLPPQYSPDDVFDFNGVLV